MLNVAMPALAATLVVPVKAPLLLTAAATIAVLLVTVLPPESRTATFMESNAAPFTANVG